MSSLRVLGGTDAAGRGLSIGVENGQQGAPHPGSPYLDATGLTVVPGFVDLQVNGGYGFDFTHDPDSIWEVGTLLPASGVTAFCPTVITSPPDRVVAAQEAMTRRPQGYRGAEPLGLHVEGPHLSSERRGTHPADLLTPATESQLSTDEVRIVTLAPEVDGAIALTRRLVDDGVVVSVGHSAATASTTRKALDAGATMGTHLFNAMPPMTAREP
ncbi:MAG: N-acetylglucosamine 6-phosphate deacetylase, partial [Acidimicrobiia bacterium]